MLTWLLGLDVIDGPLPYIVWGLTVVCILLLLVRRPTGRWLLRLVLGVVIGALIGVATVFIANTTNAFGTALPVPVAWWVGGTFAAVGLAIVSLWDSRAWRKVVAIVLIVLALLSGTLGVNAVFGIDRTIGAMFGISTTGAIDGIPGPNPDSSPTGPLYSSWTPPADMPAKGEVGLLTGADAIPSSAGFVSRDASIYLPPAALVDDAPALPFVVMMMGQPGNPDPSFIAAALDDMAAKNKGLAPIVIVADQLGAPDQDPVCADSKKFGGVSTYFNKDIVAYAKSNLNIVDDPQHWTIAGYSNGGACAFAWAAQYPEIWGNLISLSGDEYPGVENEAAATQDGYGGDAQAYAASKPAAWLQQNQGKFTGHIAVFTVGENDPAFTPGAQRNAQLAQSAGFITTYYVVPGADHVGSSVEGGLPEAFEVLYPVLGLSAS
jgi:enterochelin esterase-like enzyme